MEVSHLLHLSSWVWRTPEYTGTKTGRELCPNEYRTGALGSLEDSRDDDAKLGVAVSSARNGQRSSCKLQSKLSRIVMMYERVPSKYVIRGLFLANCT